MKIELTDQQKQALMVFLNRTQLQGAEVPAFIDLINAINKGGDEQKIVSVPVSTNN